MPVIALHAQCHNCSFGLPSQQSCPPIRDCVLERYLLGCTKLPQTTILLLGKNIRGNIITLAALAAVGVGIRCSSRFWSNYLSTTVITNSDACVGKTSAIHKHPTFILGCMPVFLYGPVSWWHVPHPLQPTVERSAGLHCQRGFRVGVRSTHDTRVRDCRHVELQVDFRV